jgi:hypothetical protein
MSHDGEIHFVERSFDAAGETTGDVEYRFPAVTVANALPRSKVIPG